MPLSTQEYNWLPARETPSPAAVRKRGPCSSLVQNRTQYLESLLITGSKTRRFKKASVGFVGGVRSLKETLRLKIHRIDDAHWFCYLCQGPLRITLDIIARQLAQDGWSGNAGFYRPGELHQLLLKDSAAIHTSCLNVWSQFLQCLPFHTKTMSANMCPCNDSRVRFETLYYFKTISL